MAMEDLQKRMDELLAVHKELARRMVRMLDRPGEVLVTRKQITERQIDVEALMIQATNNSIRLSSILEERRPRGRA